MIEIVFYLHMFIWVFIIFGGLIKEGFMKVNLLFLIPAIFLIQILLPFHIFMKYKYNYIYENMEELNLKYDIELKKISEIILDKGDIQCMPNNIDIQTQKQIFKIYKCMENQYIIPRIMSKISSYFEKSFQTPFSPQGMLILAFIINIYLLKFYWKKDCLNL